VAGVAVGSGLLLAFNLKEDEFDAKLPIIKGLQIIQSKDIILNLN
jgi:hypothetical protein